MLVRVQFELLSLGNHDPQELGHFLLDRFGIRPTQQSLDASPALLLGLGHRALPPEFALREAMEEVGLLAGHDVKAGGMVLAVLEALEAIQGQGLEDGPLGRSSSWISWQWRPSLAAMLPMVWGDTRCIRAA